MQTPSPATFTVSPLARLRWPRWACLPAALALLLAAPVFAQPSPSAQVAEPRAFGYTVGDVVQRHVTLQLPAGWVLDTAALPQTRRPGQALELRSARPDGASGLLLEYQVFIAPREVRTLEMPPVQLRFTGPAGERTLRIDAWPLTVAPLVPLEVSPRTGLGEMRPDMPPPLIDTRAQRWRLALWGGLLLLAALYLAHVHLALPWLGRRQRPFAQAWRALQALPATPSPAERRAAFGALHAALNRAAGQVLFARDLPRFAASQPRFAPLQAELQAFFTQSQGEFFAGRAATVDGAWLRRLCRALRDAERGSA